jgi:hypothetical protein
MQCVQASDIPHNSVGVVSTLWFGTPENLLQILAGTNFYALV